MDAPPCRYRCKTDHPCENEAAIDAFGMGEPSVCEQYYNSKNLVCEQGEWEIA